VPLYDYDCAACGRRFEVIHGVHDPSPEACPLCGSGPVRKAFAAPAIVFKGSGWAKKERRAAATGSKTSTGEGADKNGAGASTSDKTSTGDPGTGSSGAASDPGSASSTSASSSTSSTSSSGD
jgi:putative FmdB family regulatory protein